MAEGTPEEDRMDLNSQRANARNRKRVWLWLAMCGMLLVGGGIYWHFWRSLPTGEGPAGPVVSCEAFRHHWTERRVILVGMGDSVTAGFGASEKHSYFDRLVTNTADESPDMQGICLSSV